MRLTARLDVDMVAAGAADEVSVLVELTAPTATGLTRRKPRTLQIVIDRSASMRGRLEHAVRAIAAAIDRFDPADNVGVVAFDNGAELIVPAGPCADKAAVKTALSTLGAGGNTHLSAGYVRGIREARRVAGEAGATLLLICDGRANEGTADVDRLAAVAAEARRHGVVTSTLGWGDDYDEQLLSAIARSGSGNEGFAADSDAAVALIAGEVDGLLSQTVRAASLLVRVPEHLAGVTVANDLPLATTTDGVVVELGNLHSGETRRLVLTLAIPAAGVIGPMDIATLDLSYVDLAGQEKRTVGIPLRVNVVPAGQAAARVPDPVVRTELVYQRVQRAKRSASRHLSAGERDEALAELDAATQLVGSSLDDGLPEALAADLALEAEELRYATGLVRAGGHSLSAKYLSMSSSYKSRKRGRDLNRGGQAWQPEKPDAG